MDNNSLGKLIVKKQYYHHHSAEIMSAHSLLKDDFITLLNSTISIEPRVKLTKGVKSKAIKADFLNHEIRRILSLNTNQILKFEVIEEKGVFYFCEEKSAIGGFDFAIINHKKNITSLRNLCFGELRYYDGKKRWNRFLSKNNDLRELADKINHNGYEGKDTEYIETNIETPLIVGEIQFGNWALAYRDFFKLLKANVQNSVDCLIYIVPTDNLENMLSGGIVTFDKTVKIIKEFEKVLAVPIWVIGLDLELKSYPI